MQLDLPAPKYRNPAARPQLFKVGEAVTFNGHVGTVRGYSPEGKVLVSFGHCRRKVIEEEKLQVFIPWWSDCD